MTIIFYEYQSLAFNPLSYSEEEILTIYEDVLSFSPPEPEVDKSSLLPSIENARAEVDHKLVEASGQRLLGCTQDASNYRRILARAYEIISRAEAARYAVEGASTTPRQNQLSLGILSIAEYEALIISAVSVLVFLLYVCFSLYADKCWRHTSSRERCRAYAKGQHQSSGRMGLKNSEGLF